MLSHSTTRCTNPRCLDNDGYTFLLMNALCVSSNTLVVGLHHNKLVSPAPCGATTCDASAKIFTCCFMGKSSSIIFSHPFSAISSSSWFVMFLFCASLLLTKILRLGMMSSPTIKFEKDLIHGGMCGVNI